jgi:predicted kinase
MTRRLVLFCGIPGSGKTTIGKIVAQGLGRSVHVQTDLIRSMVTSPNHRGRESRFVYSSVILVGREALRAGYDVILDGTFLKEEYREEAISKLKRLYRTVLVVYTDCDVDIAYMRNQSRAAKVPLETFARMYSRFEHPTSALRIDTAKTSPELAAEAVLLQLRQ